MSSDTDKAAIGKLIDDWVCAVCEGDIEKAIAGRAEDILMFDVPEPTHLTGIDAYRHSWEVFFALTKRAKNRFCVSELTIAADDRLAFAYGLLTIAGSPEPQCRLTLCLEKIAGRWLVCHEHHSMPINLEPHSSCGGS